MIVLGSGSPVVLVPGVQGRWEWMRPAVEALARRSRVVSYSLCGEPGSGCAFEPSVGFDGFVRQLDAVLDAAGMRRATICGVSYGGLIGLRYAACRPERVVGLALVSTPGPGWRPDARVLRYLCAPRLMAPVFVASSPARLLPEIRAAFPELIARLGFSVRHLVRVAAAPIRPTFMAERVRLACRIDFRAACRLVRAPVLVVTGEPHLDRVVPVSSTHEFLRCLSLARAVTIDRTGHIGLVTRPDVFADVVSSFAQRAAGTSTRHPQSPEGIGSRVGHRTRESQLT